MAALILGMSKADCVAFAREHRLETWGWISPRSPRRMSGRRFEAVYATDNLRADGETYRHMVELSEAYRDRILG